MVYGNFPAAFCPQHLLFPFAVKLNRDALSASFLASLLSELIEVTNPPNSRAGQFFKDSALLHLTSLPTAALARTLRRALRRAFPPSCRFLILK
jgi:hypothetical protein